MCRTAAQYYWLTLHRSNVLISYFNAKGGGNQSIPPRQKKRQRRIKTRAANFIVDHHTPRGCCCKSLSRSCYGLPCAQRTLLQHGRPQQDTGRPDGPSTGLFRRYIHAVESFFLQEQEFSTIRAQSTSETCGTPCSVLVALAAGHLHCITAACAASETHHCTPSVLLCLLPASTRTEYPCLMAQVFCAIPN